ncbi:MAG: hypothetical protein KGJ13_06685 [Patescibacteria group bacterium]|nr:hypothetical protein [Patescibacteria group bacterium]
MGRESFEPIITIAAGIIGIALVAVLVSQRSNTAGVFAAAGGAFSNALSAAVSPVTGNSAAPNVNAGAATNGLMPFAGGGIGQGFSLSGNLIG